PSRRAGRLGRGPPYRAGAGRDLARPGRRCPGRGGGHISRRAALRERMAGNRRTPRVRAGRAGGVLVGVDPVGLLVLGAPVGPRRVPGGGTPLGGGGPPG